MDAFYSSISSLLGLHVDADKLTFTQISLRGIIVFLAALVMVRLGDRRFLSKKTIFDAILGFILASMLARAVNGNASFFPTLAAGFVLVGLHKLLAMISQRSHWFGNLIKGCEALVIKDGVLIPENMRRHDVSEHDLKEDLRLNGNLANFREVKEAYIERNGQISVVKQ